MTCFITFVINKVNLYPFSHRKYNLKGFICVYVSPGQAWTCHPGCRKFCLPSCKRSCCDPSAPNYTPDMFPKLIQFQSSITNPPPLPSACPAGCNPTCYPSCDPGCCSPQFPPPAPSVYGLSPSPYDPYAGNGECPPACAPANTPGRKLNHLVVYYYYDMALQRMLV
jgi:hypothetical protein